MEPPFLPISLIEMYVLRESLVLMGPPFSMNTLTYECFRAISGGLLALERNRQFRKHHFRLRMGVVNAKVGVVLHFHALFRRVLFIGTPL